MAPEAAIVWTAASMSRIEVSRSPEKHSTSPASRTFEIAQAVDPQGRGSGSEPSWAR